ncbi:MAG TPA: DUF2155 domain-containing protein [Geobacteraceae bacterium]
MKRVLAVALLALTVAACSQKEETKPAAAPASQGQVAKKEAVVVIPNSVKGKWKAVKIAVTDKTTNKETDYTVAIGSTFAIPNSNLAIKVENFLPHFVMEGTTLTSQSNEPKNPAAQVRILEGGKEIFKGWLFTLYPTTHAFQHPRYGFALVDFVPAS